MHLTCTICVELYQSDDRIVVTDCGHLFHTDCVTPWIERHETCPQCRGIITVASLKQVFISASSEEDAHLTRNCAAEKDKLSNDLQEAQRIIDEMQEEIEICDDESAALNNHIKLLMQNNKDLENELAQVKASQNSLDIIELETLISSYEDELKVEKTRSLSLQRQLNLVKSICGEPSGSTIVPPPEVGTQAQATNPSPIQEELFTSSTSIRLSNNNNIIQPLPSRLEYGVSGYSSDFLDFEYNPDDFL